MCDIILIKYTTGFAHQLSVIQNFESDSRENQPTIEGLDWLFFTWCPQRENL